MSLDILTCPPRATTLPYTLHSHCIGSEITKMWNYSIISQISATFQIIGVFLIFKCWAAQGAHSGSVITRYYHYEIFPPFRLQITKRSLLRTSKCQNRQLNQKNKNWKNLGQKVVFLTKSTILYSKITKFEVNFTGSARGRGSKSNSKWVFMAQITRPQNPKSRWIALGWKKICHF